MGAAPRCAGHRLQMLRAVGLRNGPAAVYAALRVSAPPARPPWGVSVPRSTVWGLGATCVVVGHRPRHPDAVSPSSCC